MQARPRGARLHDYRQQASKRGAAKEVRFPGFRQDGDGERRAGHGGERDEAQVGVRLGWGVDWSSLVKYLPSLYKVLEKDRCHPRFAIDLHVLRRPTG